MPRLSLEHPWIRRLADWSLPLPGTAHEAFRHYDRVVDVTEELVRCTLLALVASAPLVERDSERKQCTAGSAMRVA